MHFICLSKQLQTHVVLEQNGQMTATSQISKLFSPVWDA